MSKTIDMSISLFTVGIFSLCLLCSSIFVSIAYAQIFPSTHIPTNTNTTNLTSSSSHSALQQQQKLIQPIVLHLVKIISPIKGQQVRLGGNLLISGTSTDNTTSDCKVMVIVNGIKPYRTAFPNGEGGGGDYSKWNYTLTPAYTSIKQGQNKITAKFSCTNNPNLISHNSVNVTGVDTSLTPIANQLQHVAKNSTDVNTTSSGNAISSVTSSSPLGVANTKNNTNNNGTMSVSVHLAKKSVHPGDKQSIIIKVTDVNSSVPVVGASVLGRITNPSGALFKKLEITTDDTGKSSYFWTVSQDDTAGNYKTIIEVSAYGYKNSTASKSFSVSPMPVTNTTSSNNNSKNNHQIHPSTIIPIPQIRIPTILPFHLPFQ